MVKMNDWGYVLNETASKAEKEVKRKSDRARYIPGQLIATRRKYFNLIREVKELGMEDILLEDER